MTGICGNRYKYTVLYVIVLLSVEQCKKVYKKEDFHDFTDFDTYVVEFITDTAISSSNYDFIKELAECETNSFFRVK